MLNQLKQAVYYGLKRCKGSQFQQHHEWFLKNQFKPYQQLKAMQDHLLLQLLDSAYHWVPAYRHRFEAAGVYDKGRFILSNLPELPMLTREDLILHSADFTHQNAAERNIYYFKTGGSTGSPVQIVQDEDYRDWSLAATSFFYHWNGLTMGTPHFLLWAAYQDIQSQLHHWRDKLLLGFLQSRRILNCRLVSPGLYQEFIHQINAQTDCNYMVGYANELYSLACVSLEENLPLNRPFKAVYATAENLTGPMRETIETVFRCRVYNRYGCRDSGDIACQCHHGTDLHINPLYSYVEIVDDHGKPVPAGEEGQILITNLHNHSMPLIRYAVGDTAIMQEPRRCQCGREWQSFQQITGRTNEKLFLADGSRFGGAFLHTAFDHLPLLKRYQIHQISPQYLVIKLRSAVPDYVQRYTQELEEVSRRLRDWTNAPFQIEYEQTDLFDRTATGKELIIVH